MTQHHFRKTIGAGVTLAVVVLGGMLISSRRGQAFDTDKGKDGKSPRYTVIDLGTLGGTFSFGAGINNAGDVAGAAATRAQTDGFAATAFLWTKQKGMSNLGVLGPPLFPTCPTCNSGGAGVGALGEVAMGSEIAALDPNG